jgi:tRNA uridine 5-carboxymethylaminomethyl modification enzyme
MLTARGTSPVASGVHAAELLRRPQVTMADLAPFDPARPALPRAVATQAEVEIKYAGYIAKQLEHAARLERMRQKSLVGVDFAAVRGLRTEAREKLLAVQPQTVAQAMNISGVSPADVSVLLLEISRQRREQEETT